MKNNKENENEELESTTSEADLKKEAELQKVVDEQKRIEEEEKEKQEKQDLRKSIVERTDARTQRKSDKKNPEHEALKIQLIGGGATSIKEQKDLIAQNKQPYRPHFQYEKPYYEITYRLKGWPESHKKFRKRKEMAYITTGLIYKRFSKEILPQLQEKNPFIAYLIRKYKLFQFLTSDAQIQLDGFIDEYIEMAKGYNDNDWDSFEKDYCIKYKLPYQPRLF